MFAELTKPNKFDVLFIVKYAQTARVYLLAGKHTRIYRIRTLIRRAYCIAMLYTRLHPVRLLWLIEAKRIIDRQVPGPPPNRRLIVNKRV